MTISFRAIPVLPLRIAWEAEIVEFAWNRFFCDQQRRGPFRYWRHCHRVHEESRGGTAGAIVADEVEYDLPFGPLGALANALVVKKQFELLFAYRQRTLLELLEVSS
jgi:ligand-binding SRPBCC domain-containing protein